MARLPVAAHACRCFYFGRPRGRGVVAHWALIFTSSPMASNVESLLMCLFIICMSSLTERLHTSFARFQTGFLKTVEVWRFAIVLDTSPLSNARSANIFSWSASCLFIPLSFSCRAKVVDVKLYQCFFFYELCLIVTSENSSPNPKDLLLMFSKSLVRDFTFQSMIHYESGFFVYGVR